MPTALPTSVALPSTFDEPPADEGDLADDHGGEAGPDVAPPEEFAAAERARLAEALWWMDDAGMATAEYAIATLAACGFAGLLLVILRSDEVRTALLGIITRALGMG